jgi:nicotinamide-nucleotide amidase
VSSAPRRPRAAIVVTGSELVRGERFDRNGPFLAAEALRLGIEPGRITIVGDRPEELRAALREGLAADLMLVSGGLGPTHDDRTVEMVAEAAGVSLVVDGELERRIEAVSRSIAERLRRSFDDFAPGVRKQATIPAGAESIGLAGTAPGLVLSVSDCAVVVLPGPPVELQRLWPAALETAAVQEVVARAIPPARRVLRLFGVGESSVARALADAGGDGDGVEATICARDFEIHIDLLAEPGAERRADELAEQLRGSLERYVFAEDEESVEEIVLGLCRARGLRLATAESCTGGLVAARLTSVPGASEVFRGGVVAYDDAIKHQELGVPLDLLERHGAVSAEVAQAMADGARTRLGADVAVAVTGVAGPSGGTAEKPVGLVFLHAAAADDSLDLRFDFPGERDWIRSRATVAALHLVRRLLTHTRHEAG